MSGQQIQPISARESATELSQEFAPQGSDWDNGGGTEPAPKGPSVARYMAAVSRFKWLILALAVLGGAAGWGATKVIDPEYEVSATILLEQGTGTKGNERDRGPIQAEELLKSSGWQDLLRSYAIADPVVTNLGLFVEPARSADSTVFRGFRAEQQKLRPGDYRITIANGKYTLSLKAGLEVERGAVGDSIGRQLGFQWQPTLQQFAGRKDVEFNVRTPREASELLIRKLKMVLNDGSSFLFLRMTGDDAQRSAATLNAWVEQFVAVAMALKKKNISYQASILEGQQAYAAKSLSEAESALESFRVRTVTEPTERQTIQWAR
jgi:uncharacterized protein involved in exopolysaccharide biosynthesis